jgi:hypothetical protein
MKRLFTDQPKERKEQENANNSGEIMLESLLVMIPLFFVFLFLISLTFLLHQQFAVVTTANETAAKIGQTYKLLYSDPVTGYTDTASMKNIHIYRYTLGADEVALSNEMKSAQYVSWRLNKTGFAQRQSPPTIVSAVSDDSLGRRHVTVRVSGEYSIFLGEALTYFGIGGTREFTATGTAECIDVIDYINVVDYANQQLNLEWTGSKLTKMINKWMEFINGEVK